MHKVRLLLMKTILPQISYWDFLAALNSGLKLSDEQAKSLVCEVMCSFPHMLVCALLDVVTSSILAFTMLQPVSNLNLDNFPALSQLMPFGRM